MIQEIEKGPQDIGVISIEIEGTDSEPTRDIYADISVSDPEDSTISNFPSEPSFEAEEIVQTKIEAQEETVELEEITRCTNLQQIVEKLAEKATSPIIMITTKTKRQLVIISSQRDANDKSSVQIIVRTCDLESYQDDILPESWNKRIVGFRVQD